MGDRQKRFPASGQGWLAGVLAMMVVAAAAAAAAPAQEPPDPGRATAVPDPAQSGEKPVREFNDASGRLCRVYERAVVIGGVKQPAVAVVCRESNGRWVLSR